jgi:hypothetical protein
MYLSLISFNFISSQPEVDDLEPSYFIDADLMGTEAMLEQEVKEGYVATG